MRGLTVEIKARCPDLTRVRAVLRSRQAIFKGLDRQIDTYFCVPSGRLKLREGRIENALIHYERADLKNSKRCDSILYKDPELRKLKKIFAAACGVLTVVDKKREIYFIKNVKFHLDRVKKLGTFIEIEVFGCANSTNPAKLKRQCRFYQGLLGISKKDLLAHSYSDQLLAYEKNNLRPQSLFVHRAS